MKEVYPDIFLIKEGKERLRVKAPVNIYVIGGPDGLIFDAGYGNKKQVKYVVREINKIKNLHDSKGKSLKITRIMPSHAHPDHFSGLKYLKEKLGLKIITTRKTANIISSKRNFLKSFDLSFMSSDIEKRDITEENKIPLKIKILYFLFIRFYRVSLVKEFDSIVRENAEIVINNEKWKIIPSPGHSIDHIYLYNEKKGILFSGDNILEDTTTWLGPPNSNLEDYINSLEIVLNLPNLKYIFPAHGNILNDDPRKKVRELLEYRRSKTQQIFELLEEKSGEKFTFKDIVKLIYPKTSKRKRMLRSGWIWVTLQMLEKKKLIFKEIKGKNIIFYTNI